MCVARFRANYSCFKKIAIKMYVISAFFCFTFLICNHSLASITTRPKSASDDALTNEKSSSEFIRDEVSVEKLIETLPDQNNIIITKFIGALKNHQQFTGKNEPILISISTNLNIPNVTVSNEDDNTGVNFTNIQTSVYNDGVNSEVKNTITCSFNNFLEINVPLEKNRIKVTGDISVFRMDEIHRGTFAMVFSGMTVTHRTSPKLQINKKLYANQMLVKLVYKDFKTETHIDEDYQALVLDSMKTLFSNITSSLRQHFEKIITKDIETTNLHSSFPSLSGCVQFSSSVSRQNLTSSDQSNTTEATVDSTYIIKSKNFDTCKYFTLHFGPIILNGLTNFTLVTMTTSKLRGSNKAELQLKIETGSITGKCDWFYQFTGEIGQENKVFSFSISDIEFTMNRQVYKNDGEIYFENEQYEKLDMKIGSITIESSNIDRYKYRENFVNHLLSENLKKAIIQSLENEIKTEYERMVQVFTTTTTATTTTTTTSTQRPPYYYEYYNNRRYY